MGFITIGIGNLEERNSYYPYGMLMPAEADGALPAEQPYKWSGKEYLTIHGINLYDFGPRALFSPLGIFTQPDPECESYPGISPYTYCAGNPVNLVDPTGLNIWNIDQNGYITSVIETDKCDKFVVEKADGSKDEREYLYGTVIEEVYSNVGRVKNGDLFNFLAIKVRGDDNSRALFEFLASNTNVEWSLAMLGQEEIGPSYISTSHNEKNERSISFLINTQFMYSYTLRSFFHSHSESPFPSGLANDKGEVKEKGDIQQAAQIQAIFGGNVTFGIFMAKTTFRTIYYKPTSVYTEFGITYKN